MILCLTGTKDGREIANHLSKSGLDVIASTTTEYGASLYDERVKVHIGILDEKSLMDFVKSNGIDTVVDATHPFAKDISINAINVCKKLNIKYIRYERKTIYYDKSIIVNDYKEALEKAFEFDNIFLTTGSKNLEIFMPLVKAGKRMIARVLPVSIVIKKCEDLGLKPSDIIAMQGPFSVDLNYHMFKQAGADVIITKESGITGGVLEKFKAARMLNIPVILIKRPEINYPLKVSDMEELKKEIAF
ncbi:MAG: precorrin-6A reductase [Thermoanaerobacteraceae bacterium]|nr:precorrin-6A reductase [Thermoanaerobacteraceae bacterium]